MRIYWIEDGKRCGPATVPDVLSKVQLGELSPDTPGWHAGCEKWVPLKELPALADFLGAPAEPPVEPAEAPEDAAPAEEAEPAGSSGFPQGTVEPSQLLNLMLPGPMTRFLARMVDMSLYATLVLGIMYIFRVPYMSSFHPGRLLFWVPMLVIEAILINGWGTTPGKYWLGVRLVSMGGRVALSGALMRSVMAFALGMGCMVPLLSLFTMAISFVQLRRKGYLPWDIISSTLPVLTRPLPGFQRLAVVVYLFLTVSLCGQYMQPWLPDMQRELREESPEAAEFVERFLPPQQ